MKKIFKTILGCLCVASVILAGAENPDGSCNVLWTIAWMASAVLSAFGFKKMEEAK